jgi:hypothetical protein
MAFQTSSLVRPKIAPFKGTRKLPAKKKEISAMWEVANMSGLAAVRIHSVFVYVF